MRIYVMVNANSFKFQRRRRASYTRFLFDFTNSSSYNVLALIHMTAGPDKIARKAFFYFYYDGA